MVEYLKQRNSRRRGLMTKNIKTRIPNNGTSTGNFQNRRSQLSLHTSLLAALGRFSF